MVSIDDPRRVKTNDSVSVDEFRLFTVGSIPSAACVRTVSLRVGRVSFIELED